MSEKTKEKARDEKFKEACPESAKELEKIDNGIKQALFDMQDKAFQKGLVWRMKQAQSVRILIAEGWSQDKILKEFRHNGMTETTARKIIEDALC